MTNNDKYNSEGYLDMTSYIAMRNIETVPNYGTVNRNGITYFRTRLTDADGKR